jgi:hypothetical protein
MVIYFFDSENPQYACFSNLSNHTIEEGKYRYSTLETYIQCRKAAYFNDHKKFKMILQSNSPSDIRNLGGNIHGYDHYVWQKQVKDIVLHGIQLKINQHPDVRETLINTGTNCIALASPRDIFWGIGLSIKEARENKYQKWPGQNHLGELWMQARSMILKQDNTKRNHDEPEKGGREREYQSSSSSNKKYNHRSSSSPTSSLSSSLRIRSHARTRSTSPRQRRYHDDDHRDYRDDEYDKPYYSPDKNNNNHYTSPKIDSDIPLPEQEQQQQQENTLQKQIMQQELQQKQLEELQQKQMEELKELQLVQEKLLEKQTKIEAQEREIEEFHKKQEQLQRELEAIQRIQQELVLEHRQVLLKPKHCFNCGQLYKTNQDEKEHDNNNEKKRMRSASYDNDGNDDEMN